MKYKVILHTILLAFCRLTSTSLNILYPVSEIATNSLQQSLRGTTAPGLLMAQGCSDKGVEKK
jgi:hypothetical protein